MNIIQIFPGHIWGGAEQYVLDLSMALEKKGHNIVLLSGKCRVIRKRLEGIKYVRQLPFKGLFDMFTIMTLSHIIQREDIDLIHIHDFKFVAMIVSACRLSGKNVKVVVTRHVARRSRTSLFRRFFLRRVHRIVFVSEFSRRIWLSANPWIDTSLCDVVLNSIPNTNDMLRQKTCSLRLEYGVAEGIPIVMFTGRVRRSKGCTVVAEALTRLKHLPFHVIFVGKCKPLSYERRLKSIFDKSGMGHRVHFTGFRTDVRMLISEADIGVAPSIVKESCHLSPMEFMQQGKPVVTTNNGAQPEYIDNYRTGILVNPDDINMLSSAVESLLTDDNMCVDIGNNAKCHFENNLNYTLFINKILSVYN